MRADVRTAIVHDWIVDIGGAEKCLQSIYALYPSDVFTLVADEMSARSIGLDPDWVHRSFVNRLPWAKQKYRTYLPLMPLAIEQMELSPFDLVISSSHAVAKGVLTHNDQLHICYCYTPVRYAWDLYHEYLREAGLVHGVRGFLARSVLHYLRMWDVATAPRVDHFVAISHYIARRIRHIYNRESTVIYPPVDLDAFDVCTDKDDYYVTASRMVPYKKLHLLVEAFTAMADRRLVVVGQGPEMPRIRALAGPNVALVGWQTGDALRRYLQRARAFLFAAEEDFGILPLEAQACGTPVIAFGRGGCLETVIENETGIFFREQNAKAIIAAVEQFESLLPFSPDRLRANAERFCRRRFERELSSFVEDKMAAFLDERERRIRRPVDAARPL